MSAQSWQEVLVNTSVTGGDFASFTTAKTVIPAPSLLVLPAGYFGPQNGVGRMLRLTVMGAISNIATTPGTIVFQMMFGSNIVFTTGNIQLNATAHTKLPFRLQALLTCQVVGSGTTAKFMGMGEVAGVMFTRTAAQVDGPNTSAIIEVPQTAPAQGAGFDSSIANIVDFFCGFSISDPANLIRIEQYVIESLN